LSKTLLLLALALLGVCSSAAAQPPYGLYLPTTPAHGALYRDGSTESYLLGGEWLYQADRGDVGIANGWWRDTAVTAGWTPVTVPNAYNAGDLSVAGMTGYAGWYRKDFLLPRLRGDVHWILRFENVYYRATVWLNGREIGAHVGGYLPFELDLNGLRTGTNRLIVRVDNTRTLADLPPATGASGGWWNYGGLLQEVYLRAVRGVDISRVIVRPLLPCPSCSATVQEQVSLRNVSGVAQTVRLRGTFAGARVPFAGPVTIAPGATVPVSASLRIAHPHLWAIGSPYLYRATLTLTGARDQRLGGYVTYSGIRSIAVRNGLLYLNGRRLNLRGFDLHEQDIVLGAALDTAHYQAIVGWVRELGADVIRAHYPLDPQLLESADRDGILVWDEIPVYQVQTQFLTDPSWLAAAHQMLTENIEEDQNHPAVMLWGVANELPTPAPPQEASYLGGAAAIAHGLDPTRPVGMAISDWPGVACTTAYDPLDVIGYNDYFGWFDAGAGATADRDQLGPFLDSLRGCYPDKAIMITEFGFEANRAGPVEERGTYAFQIDSDIYHLAVFASKRWLSGALYFALQWFAVRPGFGTGGNPLPDPPFQQKGPIGLYGEQEPAFGTLQQIYTSTEQIAPSP
jgi:beta-glucuronidase